jgi:hypothetical protein
MDGRWNEWRDRVLRPLVERHPPLAEDLGHLGGVALLSADTDRTQEYVFESSRLPEIRGGSLLLSDLIESEARLEKNVPRSVMGVFEQHGLPHDLAIDDPPGCIVYAGGGSLLAVVPSEIAEVLAAEIERLFPQETGLATITCVWREVEPADMAARFDALMAIQEMALRRAKGLKALRPFVETLPFAQRCRSCGQRPATTTLAIGTSEHVICGPCLLKHDYGRGSARKRWLERFDGFLDRKGLRESFYDPRQVSKAPIAPPNDLSDLGEAAQGKKSGYIGFIYADGDEVGDYVQSRTTVKEYCTASRHLRSVTQDCVFHALAESLTIRPVTRLSAEEGKKEEEENVSLIPFEIITIGGDDVLLIVPADAALPVAKHLSQRFGQKMAGAEKEEERTLTMSVGVILAQHHTPVRTLRNLAGQLLKHGAKVRRRQTKQDGNPEACIDFLVLKSQAMLGATVSELRNEPPYLIEQAGEKLLLTHSPYTLSELEDLLGDLRALQASAFPASQLHLLASALQKGRHAATLFYQYQLVRLSKTEEEQAQILIELGQRWSPAHSQDPVPWTRTHSRGVKYQTAFADLVELYDFVPRNGA